MWQGVPKVPCPNTKCENHEFKCYMDVFAVMWNQPVPGVYVWNNDVESRDDDEIQTFFRFVRCVIPFMLAINAHNSSEMFQHKHNKALHTDNLQLRLQAPYAYGSG